MKGRSCVFLKRQLVSGIFEREGILYRVLYFKFVSASLISDLSLTWFLFVQFQFVITRHSKVEFKNRGIQSGVAKRSSLFLKKLMKIGDLN